MSCVALLAGAPAAALPPSEDDPFYSISRFEFRYAGDARGAPPLDEILDRPVSLGQTDTGYVDPSGASERVALALDSPLPAPRRFHAGAIGAISAQILARYHERNLLGVYVAPHEADIDPANERDLRRPGDTVLRIVITLGRVQQLRSVGFGDRLDPTWRVDHPVHRRIRERSPIQPDDAAHEGSSSLLDSKALDDYLMRLNRHPGRRVDAALSPSEKGDGVALDFRVSESRPWFAYAQTSNNGTDETNRWQTRLGYINQQLTNRDDILSVEYLNAGGDAVNGVSGRYEAPWFGSRHPSWYRRSETDAGWRPRNWLPWWGSDRMRWRLGGGWIRTLSEGVERTDDYKSEEWRLGGELVYNAWQRQSWFIDVSTGTEVRSLLNKNQTISNDASWIYMFLPKVGARMERSNEYSDMWADVQFEFSAKDIRKEDLQLLGRIRPDDRWNLMLYDAGWTYYLEPLLNRAGWEDPSTPRSSTLAHELSFTMRGQYSFGARLIPQVTQVIGGLYTVRGYDPSVGLGDDVIIGSLEYRFHLPRALPLRPSPLRLPWLGTFRWAPQQPYGRPDWDLVLRAFVDGGRTWKNKRGRVPSGSVEQEDTLVGAGVGVELVFGTYVRARMDYGVAITAAGRRDDRTRPGDDEFHFLFSIVY